jgi:hypothetical protein
MRRLGFRTLALPALLVLFGCATSEEWATWRSHPSHFASGAHLTFSVRNTEAKAARVTRQDVVFARDESWWGKPVTVDQQQIIER